MSVRKRTAALGLPSTSQRFIKPIEGVHKIWRRLDGQAQLPKLVQGVKFYGGLEVTAELVDRT